MAQNASRSEVESRAVTSPKEISEGIPKEIPNEISKENPNELSKLIEPLIEENKSAFNTDEQLKTMSGGPKKIKLKDRPIKSLHVNTPRKTPYAYQGAAKGKLDHMVRLGILEKVEDVSEWCSPMSFVSKPDGDMRPVVDLVHLNKFMERPVHPFPTPRDPRQCTSDLLLARNDL